MPLTTFPRTLLVLRDSRVTGPDYSCRGGLVTELEIKPLLRGVSHEVAAAVALAGAILLVGFAPAGAPRMGALVYGTSLCGLFLVSALYHRAPWSPAASTVMQRLDHSAIFTLIAGTYTPLCLLLGPPLGYPLLGVVWSGALLGIARVFVWPTAPRALAVGLYVLLGWTALPALPSIADHVGAIGLGLLGLGGAAYTIGAAVYATRKPDPYPTVFGYHEVFHVLVIGAAACHYAVVVMCIAEVA